MKNNDLKEIEKKIKKIESKQNKKKSTVDYQGARVGTEFILSILVGAFMGHAIDLHFDTKPIATISLTLLGLAAGMMTIYKIFNNVGDTVGFSPLQNKEKTVKETQQKDSNK